MFLLALTLLAAGIYYFRSGTACLAGKGPTRPPLSLEDAETMMHEKQQQQAQEVATCTTGYIKILISLALFFIAALLLVEGYLARCGMAFLNLW